MKYKVIKYFVDLLDGNRPYNVGDSFPHKDVGYEVSEERLAELSSGDNKQGVPLIKQVVKKTTKKKTAEE